MDNFRLARLAASALTVLAIALAAGACGDNPVDEDREHGEPEGLVIRMGGQTLVTVAGQQVTGHLAVQEGEETAHMTVAFTDHDGEEIEFDDEFYLEVDVEDEATAEFEQDTPGEFGGHLHGHAAGTTRFTFKLMHGAVGSGHPDYVSPEVTVVVGP